MKRPGLAVLGILVATACSEQATSPGFSSLVSIRVAGFVEAAGIT